MNPYDDRYGHPFASLTSCALTRIRLSLRIAYHLWTRKGFSPLAIMNMFRLGHLYEPESLTLVCYSARDLAHISRQLSSRFGHGVSVTFTIYHLTILVRFQLFAHAEPSWQFIPLVTKRLTTLSRSS